MNRATPSTDAAPRGHQTTRSRRSFRRVPTNALVGNARHRLVRSFGSVVTAAVAVVAMVTVAAPGAGASTTPTWTDAQVAGALNAGGSAQIMGVSCTSATSCVAGGSYFVSNYHAQAFVSVLSGTTWTDTELAGALNAGGSAQITSVSCTSASFCVAGGYYKDSNSKYQAFVSVFNGTNWTCSEVAGVLNAGGSAQINSVSCTSASFCVAGGYYGDSNGNPQAFVSVYNGTTWTDTKVAGALNIGGYASIASLSCTSATSCVAGGYYYPDSGYVQAFVSVYNGTTWTDTEVVGALSTDGFAGVNSVSCASASFCVAGGYYQDSNGYVQAFVSVYNGTTWTDTAVAGALNTLGFAQIISVSCTSASSCVAGGNYEDSNGITQAFVSVLSSPTPSTPSISNLPTSATYGGSFTPTVSTTGDGPTSVTSSTTSVCTVDPASGLVSYVGAGTCTLDAHVASGTNYSSADGADQSFSVAAVKPSAPGTPALTDNHGSVRLSWPAPTSSGGDTVTYNVEELTNKGSWSEVATGLTAPTYTYQGTTAKSTYSFAIVAVNSAGRSGWSAAAYLQAVAVRPSIPGTPSLTDNHGSFTVTWSPSANNGGDVVTYKVEELTNHGSWSEVATGLTSPTYTYQGTTAKSTYCFAIVAANSAGQSAWSPSAYLRAS